MRRLYRDDQRIHEIEGKVVKFLAEVDDVILRLDASVPLEANLPSDCLLTQLQDSLSLVQGPQPVVGISELREEV